MKFRRIAAAFAIPAVIAGIGIGSSVHDSPRMTLTAGHDFSITGTISSSPTAPVRTLLYPGTARYLILTVHNPLAVPIAVTSVQVATQAASTRCRASNLDLSRTSFSGSRRVPGRGDAAITVPIRMANSGNQNSCQGLLFPLKFSGSAIYARVYPTNTRIASSVDPSRVGQRVNYTATVRAGNTSERPTGTVTFTDGGRSICAQVPVSAGGTATCAPPPYLSAGKHSIVAAFTDPGGSFSASRSATLIQIVTAPARCTRSHDPDLHLDCTVVSR
jgi:Big-like domain-containing protein